VNTLIGIFELAIGRASGFGRFSVSQRAFRNSVIVLFSVPALLSLALASRQGVIIGLSMLLAVFCALLAPAVISDLLARAWGREAWWLRFAIAFNWSRIALTSIYAVLLTIAAILISLGHPNRTVAGLIQSVMVIYTLWFDWFLVRQGLQVTALRAVMGVLAINFGTFLMVFGPLFLADALSPDGAAGTN